MPIVIKGLDRLQKKLNSIKKATSLGIDNLTKEEAKRGAKFAKDIAPRDTGALIQAIEFLKIGKANEYMILSRLPTRGNKRRRPYHQMMHGLSKRFPDIANKIREKEPGYMFVTADMLRKEYFAKAREFVKGILNK